MRRERQQTPADLTEQDLATLDALLDEPDSAEPEAVEVAVVPAAESLDPSLDSIEMHEDANRRRFIQDVLVALDGPLAMIDEGHLTLGDSDSFEALIKAREDALRPSVVPSVEIA